jgi:hypothetical protein
MKTKFVSCHTADSQPVQQEVSGTVILPPLVFPAVNVSYAPVAYYDTATIRALKCFFVQVPGSGTMFIVQVPGACTIKHFAAVINSVL